VIIGLVTRCHVTFGHWRMKYVPLSMWSISSRVVALVPLGGAARSAEFTWTQRKHDDLILHFGVSQRTNNSVMTSCPKDSAESYFNYYQLSYHYLSIIKLNSREDFRSIGEKLCIRTLAECHSTAIITIQSLNSSNLTAICDYLPRYCMKWFPRR